MQCGVIVQKRYITKRCVIAFTEELTSSASLKVTPSREPLFTRKLDILEVIEGRTARFDCKVSGLPAPRVTWMHFGKSLLMKVFRITNSSSMEIFFS